MHVRRRLSPPPSSILPTVLAEVSGPLLSAKESLKYLSCSHHEIRELERRGIIRAIPYFGGRLKPRRYLKCDLDRHIAEQVGQARQPKRTREAA